MRAASALDVRQTLSSCKSIKCCRLCLVFKCGRDWSASCTYGGEGNILAENPREMGTANLPTGTSASPQQMPKPNTIQGCYFNVSLVPPVCLHRLVPNRLTQVFSTAQIHQAGAVKAQKCDHMDGPPVLHPCFMLPSGSGACAFTLDPNGFDPGVL